jgi:hypothetical protein
MWTRFVSVFGESPMSHFKKLLILALLIGLPHVLGGAVCSRALDLPIIVKGTLPNEFSKSAFALDVDKALQAAGITSTNGKVPAGSPETVTFSHTDVLDLSRKEEFKKYGAKVHSAYINYISLELVKNTLSTQIPELQFALAPTDTNGKPTAGNKFESVAQLPPLAKGIIGTPAEIVWEEKKFEQANQIIKSSTVGVRIETTIKLTPGADMPTGILEFNVHFEAASVLTVI